MTIDYDNEILLITAASGKQASALIPHLTKKWKQLRLAVNSSSSLSKLQKTYPDADVVIVDLASSAECTRLIDNTTACFLITPGFHPSESRCGSNVIDAAVAQRANGGPFKHLVYSSVLHPLLRDMTNHDNKLWVERHLVASQIPFTVVQPTHLMETFPLKAVVQHDHPVRPAPWDPETKFSFVSCIDVGEAAARILEQREAHFAATYQLVGTQEPLSYVEAMEIVSKECGKEVRNEQKPIEEAAEAAVAMSAGDKPPELQAALKQGFARMFLHYNEQGLIGNSNVSRMLLGREPLGYQAWVRRSLGKA